MRGLCLSVCLWVCLSVYLSVCLCAHARMRVCVCVHGARACVRVCAWASVCMCVLACVCICAYACAVCAHVPCGREPRPPPPPRLPRTCANASSCPSTLPRPLTRAHAPAPTLPSIVSFIFQQIVARLLKLVSVRKRTAIQPQWGDFRGSASPPTQTLHPYEGASYARIRGRYRVAATP